MTVSAPSADLHELPVAYRDACAADLGLFLDLPGQDALARRQVAVDGWTVDLRILGASHQVLAHRGGVLACSETVACRPDAPAESASLPARLHRAGAVAHYTVASRVDVLEPAAFESLVDGLLGDLADAAPLRSASGDGAVALWGRFPGDPWATTGLRLQPVGTEELQWSGWHSYPQSGEVVTTSSRLVLHAPLRPGAGRCR